MLLVVVMWTGELRRTIRASCYLADVVEPRLHDPFPSLPVAPLRWEAWLREGENMKFTETYWAVPLLLALVGVASAAVGISELISRATLWWSILAIAFDLLALVTALRFFWRTRQAVRSPPWA